MAKYAFKRRAKNEAWSGRTARAGRAIEGTIKDAVKKAAELTEKQGEIKIHNDQDHVVGKVRYYDYDRGLKRLSVEINVELVEEFMS